MNKLLYQQELVLGDQDNPFLNLKIVIRLFL